MVDKTVEVEVAAGRLGWEERLIWCKREDAEFLPRQFLFAEEKVEDGSKKW